MSKEKKTNQLGMNPSTANGRLRKMIIFDYAQKCGHDHCFQCGEKIESIEEFSIEHKIPYLDSDDPKDLFFNLNNISYSHLQCNVGARRGRTGITHPSEESYKQGCRCHECKNIKKMGQRRHRENKKHAL